MRLYFKKIMEVSFVLRYDTIYVFDNIKKGDEVMTGTQSIINYAIPILFLAMLYFLMIRPQQKREKAQKEMRAALKVGDKILTIGGIVGTIVKIQEDTVVIETGDNKSRITFDKVGISRLKSDDNEN